jgi:hypothetical protein
MTMRMLMAIAIMTTIACSTFAPETGPLAPLCSDADSDPTKTVVFARDIRPLMSRERFDPDPGCKTCHYSTEASHAGTDLSGLDLATLGSLRRGGANTGARIVIAGKPCSSALVQKLDGTYPGSRMPKDATRFWTAAEIQLVMDWIAEGANGRDDE